MTTITIKDPLLGHIKNCSFAFKFAAISWLLMKGYLPLTSNPNKFVHPTGLIARLHTRKKS